MSERLLDDGDLNQLNETKLKNQLSKLSWWLRFGSFILIPLGILSIVGTLSLGTSSYIRTEEILILIVLLFLSIGVVYIGWYARKTALANDEHNQQETEQSHLMMAKSSHKLWRLFAWVIIPIAIVLNGTMLVVVYDDYYWRQHEPTLEPAWIEQPVEEEPILDVPLEEE